MSPQKHGRGNLAASRTAPKTGQRPHQAREIARPSVMGSSADGWVGTKDLPGYCAGKIVVQLADLPQVDPDHLYLDLLLLDSSGQTEDTHSGPCRALEGHHSLEERARFVRVVAELLRHAVDEEEGLAAIGQVLTFIWERGVEIDKLVFAARLLDAACSEHAVTESLNNMLELLLGKEVARRTISDVVDGLVRESGFGRFGSEDSEARQESGLFDIDSLISGINSSGLNGQLSYIVRTVGKLHARSYLHDVTGVDLVPQAAMFGL
jgi:hypothetical protein